MKRNLAWLALFMFVSFLPAVVGSRSTPDAWYQALQKPTFNPPNWIFAPVWTILYALMGFAAWLVWRRAGFDKARSAFAMFGLQLVLNGLWTWFFFGLHSSGWALVDILALWISIVLTIVLFARHSTLAAVSLLPYVGWVSFAAVLNLFLWLMNS